MKIYALYICYDGKEHPMYSFKTIEGAKKYANETSEFLMDPIPEWVFYECENYSYWHTKDGKWQILEEELKE